MRSPFHGRIFRPGFIPTLAMLPLLALLLWLGQWQWDRAAEKQTLLDRWASQALLAPVALPTAPDGNTAATAQFQRVFANGAYLPGSQVLLDNQTRGGKAGYRILTPLLLADGSALMVDRGWVLLGTACRTWRSAAPIGAYKAVSTSSDRPRYAKPPALFRLSRTTGPAS